MTVIHSKLLTSRYHSLYCQCYVSFFYVISMIAVTVVIMFTVIFSSIMTSLLRLRSSGLRSILFLTVLVLTLYNVATIFSKSNVIYSPTPGDTSRMYDSLIGMCLYNKCYINYLHVTLCYL